MAKQDGTVGNSSEVEEASWGTWEELLLAFAVNRYGANRWDSISVELQKRSSSPARLLSPHNCKLRYLQLKRRYANGNDEDNNEEKLECCVPFLLEELRKLRVDELRREVERYDLSIVSLQLKKKQLEEERDNVESKSDLAKNDKNEIGIKSEEDKSSGEDDSQSSSTDPKQSCSLQTAAEENEKTEQARTGSEKIESTRAGSEKTEPVRTGSLKEAIDKCSEEKPVREDSYNGSSDSVEKLPVEMSMKVEPVSESPELVESVAESKVNSDVQSSVGKNVNDKVYRGCSSGNEREKENPSPTVKEIPVESQPLIALLDRIRSHKLGSMFERLLETQETERYSNLVRQHVDLETVQTWVENGHYSSCKSKFFRDLLLLASNAMVFFKKSSSEFVTATELRQLILKEISLTKSKLDSSAGKIISLKSASLSEKEMTKPSESLVLKTNMSGSMIVCRKRSSITAKASVSSSVGDKRREQNIAQPVEKVVVDVSQQPTELATNVGENRITKKRRQDRFASGSASLKKNEKSNSNTTSLKNSAVVVHKNQGNGESSPQQQFKGDNKNQQSKGDNRNQQSNTDVKKRNAANFLNRMKQSSSSNNDLLQGALKSTALSSDNKAISGQKKKVSGMGGGRKETASSKNPEPKQAKDKGSPKNLGRAPKRGADPSPPSSKRNREGAESATIVPTQPRKRSRR